MALLKNFRPFADTPMKFMTGPAEGNCSVAKVQSGNNRGRFYRSETSVAYATWANPTGYYPSGTWVIPQKAGELSTYYNLVGTGTISFANLAGGKHGEATLTGSGTISNADLGLIVQLVAALTGLGTLSGSIIGQISAAASLTGTGTLSGNLGALGGLVAALTGSGTVAAAIQALGNMSADITTTGDLLTTSNVGPAVWSAIASENNTPLTMGEQLNNAGAGGNPWDQVIESGYTAQEILKLLAAVAAGKLSGAPNSPIQITGIDGTTIRVSATVDSSGNRTSVTYDVS